MDKAINPRIVLLGKTGAGKSSSGNTILGQEIFENNFSPQSVTRTCECGKVTIDEQIISVIDTPGLFDTAMPKKKIKDEIVRCVEMSAPGPHVFLLVIRLGVKITDEEKNAVKWIQDNFGENTAHYIIILFTHAEMLEEKPLDVYINESNDLQVLVNESGGRFHSFNNENMRNRSQVTELMIKINEMVMNNGGEHYTNRMYEKPQENIEQESLKQKLKLYGKTLLTVMVALKTAEKAVAAAVAAAGETAGTGAAVAASAVVGGGTATVTNIATEAVVLTGRATIFSAIGGAALVVARGVGKGAVTAARLAGGPAATAVRVVSYGAAALAGRFK